MRTRPINSMTAGAASETERGSKHMRRYYFCDLVARDVLEPTVALAAPRSLEGRFWSQTEPVEDLRQLVFETVRTNQNGPRANGRKLTVARQQPAPVDSGPLGEQAILHSRLQKHSIEAKEPQPARQRSEHRVA